MKIVSRLISIIGIGILIGYYLETSNRLLTIGVALTCAGIGIGLVASSKTK